MLKIGDIKVSSSLMLAPLAGISDFPFRMVNRSFGCEFAFTEMISARALVYGNKNTTEMLSTIPADRPLGVQLLGADPDIIRTALDIVQKFKFDLIDFNAACPVNKVTTRGEGAGLLRDPRQLKALLKAAVDHSDAPVTVKIRSGWEKTSVNAREAALHAQDAGIKALFIHGRTREQGYSGRVDYDVIREVKKALAIPVIASGDALSPQLIKKMFDETGCDGVTIARGALGNPWIFREAPKFLKNGAIPPRPCLNEIADTMIRHLKLCSDSYGEAVGTILFRKLFVWYTKGIRDIKPFKERAFRAKTKDEMTAIIEEVRMERAGIVYYSSQYMHPEFLEAVHQGT